MGGQTNHDIVRMKTPVNLDAPVLTQQSIFIAAAPPKVWGLLADIAAWPTWQSKIRRTRLRGAAQPGTEFDWKLGPLGLRNKLHTVDPIFELGWDGFSLGMYAVHNWTLRGVTGGTQVTVEESMRGWPAVLLRRVLTAQITRVNKDWLNQLKVAAEK
jgi:Polyketide cyclase / dehydrase and lipid transport